MSKNTLSISVRYIPLFVIIIDILSQNSKVDDLLIFYFFAFMINNQLRYFNLKNNNNFKIISLFIDLILIYFLSTVCIRYSYISNLAIKSKLDFNSFYIRKYMLSSNNSFNKLTSDIAFSLYKIYNKC